ncbi:hypothetical protein LR69_01413 [Geobacillus sp. BCO2]|nr:hypothetical protein LR69_01413 [Geobacillus sp. BCO2]
MAEEKTKGQEKNGRKPLGKAAEADGRKVERARKAAKTTVKGHHAGDEHPVGHRKTSSYFAQETSTSTTKGSKWERNARSPFLLCMIE